MAAQTKVTVGNTTTYTITDNESNTVTVAQTVAVTGNTSTFGGTGTLHYDGQQMLALLMLELSTGLLP